MGALLKGGWVSDMEHFSWFTDKRHRRAALRDAERAIRSGQLDGADPSVVERRRALLNVVSGVPIATEKKTTIFIGTRVQYIASRYNPMLA
jgi:hypothetical protein